MSQAARSAVPQGADPRLRLVAGDAADETRAGSAARPALWKAALAYAGAVAVSVALMAAALKLERADLHVPLCYTWDSVLCQTWIKGVLEHGWYLENPDLGAPVGQQMYDFPLADSLHFLAIKGLGRVVPDPAAVYNLYYLLTFPLTTLTTLFALRRFRVSYAVSVTVALLFTFLPLHFARLIHYFLACYYVVPLMGMVVLQVYLGKFHTRRVEDGTTDSRWALAGRWLVGLLACGLTGMAGIYYAFFACFFLLVAGVAALCARRGRLAAGAAVALILAVCVSAGLTLSPSILYKEHNGPNPAAVERGACEAEIYGLRITQLLLPVTEHRVPLLARFKRSYNRTAPLVNENDTASLGVVGGAGFLLLLAWLLLRRRAAGSPGLLDGLAVCTGAGVLLATMGGLSSLFTYLTVPYIRGYNRIAVYLGFFALCAVAVVLQRAADCWARTPARKAVFWVLLTGLLGVGIFDQTCPAQVPEYARWRRDYAEDEDFARRLEAAVPPGTLVYQLPYMPFPEVGPKHGITNYDLFRPYLHAHALRWSYGAMKGREADDWQRALLPRTPAERLPLLAFAGFGGVYVDRAGYEDHGAALEADLARLLDTAPLVSSTGRFAFYDMAPYTRALKEKLTDEEWRQRQEAVLHPVAFRWLPGWHLPEESEAEGTFRWCTGPGEVRITNDSDHPRRLTVRMTCQTPDAGPWHLRIDGELWQDEVRVDGQGRAVTKGLVVPPGTHAVRFTCDRPPAARPGDGRVLSFRILNFVAAEEF
jgi:phosphoglycerol transferase